MKIIGKMFFYMIKQITQEMMMIMLILAPFLAGFFLNWAFHFWNKQFYADLD